MSAQVSVEAALPIFRQRCGELHDENLILRARVAELEQQLGEAQQQAPAAPFSPEPPAGPLPEVTQHG
ncbi:hypothetical protein [Streptomyces sp. NPDC001635]